MSGDNYDKLKDEIWWLQQKRSDYREEIRGLDDILEARNITIRDLRETIAGKNDQINEMTPSYNEFRYSTSELASAAYNKLKTKHKSLQEHNATLATALNKERTKLDIIYQDSVDAQKLLTKIKEQVKYD